ncbi:DUF7706 family protein [Janthinobacterium lividum]|jgi:hypothetical protein|nr:hypothetical protein [Janthinobacterium lividum]MCL6484898.1 hypothetical protein [Janthinobacterium lividum]
MMSGFQTEVRPDMRTPAEVAADTPVEITVNMHPAVAYQLAQFAKRSTYSMFYEFTEAHLSEEERMTLAYQMLNGITAVGAALADAGYAPR